MRGRCLVEGYFFLNHCMKRLNGLLRENTKSLSSSRAEVRNMVLQDMHFWGHTKPKIIIVVKKIFNEAGKVGIKVIPKTAVNNLLKSPECHDILESCSCLSLCSSCLKFVGIP